MNAAVGAELASHPDSRAGEMADAALAAAGDGRAFERLYSSHVARIYTLARRMAGTERAEELTQDVFVRAWQKLPTFRGEAGFGTWLYRLAVNLILGRLAAGRADRERFEEDRDANAELAAKGGSLELAIDFESAVEHLPHGARQVFVLHDVEGFTHREIGEMLGITEGTSKAQLHRARMMLRRHLAG